MDPASSEVINKLKCPPTNIGGLRSLLGFINCYRSSIKNFSRRVKPLYDLLVTETPDKKQTKSSKTPIKWNQQHQEILEEMLEHLKSPAVMAFPDFDKDFVLHCDACEKGLGAVLYQENNDGKLKVICYGSRTLSPAETNYHIHSGKLEFLSLKWSVCDRFKHYLYYAKWFVVYSDNNPLSYVQTTAKLNATGLRWMADLSQYNFLVKYRPGKDHVDCDFLSRLEEYTEETSLSDQKDESTTVFAIEAKLQSKIAVETAKHFDQIIPSLASKVKPSLKESRMWKKENRELVTMWESLVLDNDLLKRSTNNGLVVVVPKVLRTELMKTIHEGSGHLGATKCYDLAKTRIYWPGMKADITEYVTQLCKCIKNKSPNRKQIAPLIPIRSSKPFEIIGIDYLKLDKCKGNFEYLLVVTDHFSRFSQTFATKNKTGKSAAERIFNEFVINYGFPDRIHHDQGKEFNNKMWDQLHHLSGIKKSNTTPYHPMGNGQTERFNRTIINLLKALEPAQKKDWKNYVRKLCYAYNCTVNRSTGYSPHFLMFGRDPKIPVDIVLDNKVENKGPQSEFVRQWKETFGNAIKDAQKHHEAEKGKAKHQYDKTSFGEELEEGDHVLIRNLSERGGTGKLRSFYEDETYVVVSKTENLPVYMLKQLEGTKIKKLHRNHIKKIKKTLSNQRETVPPQVKTNVRPSAVTEEEEKEEEDEFEQVENIEIFFNFLRGGEARKTLPTLTPVVVVPTMTAQESVREMSKLSSADIDFFETPLVHLVQNGPTVDDSSRPVCTFDDSAVPSRPVGGSSPEAHPVLDSSGYCHTTNGGLSDDSSRPVCTLDDSAVPPHPVGDSSPEAHRELDSSRYFRTNNGGLMDDSSRPACTLEDSKVPSHSVGDLSERAHSEDSSGYFHPENDGLQEQFDVDDDDEDVLLEESGHHGVSPITSDHSLNNTEDEVSDSSEDEVEDSTSSNQLAYDECLQLYQFGRPKRIRKPKKFLTYDKRGVPSYVYAQAIPPNK
uniref:Integrase catalytic domain-containing protein n=1 Tax=Clytia hemisphaerica TaxID=252671 RepID=A0A7M5XJ10_9CNID